jgi:glucose-6-phosphate isomerase
MKTIPVMFHDVHGILTGDEVQCSQKYLKDAAFFQDKSGVDPETLLYDVYFREEEAKPGHLNWGLTVLYPVTVNGEYNMTRGHYHMDREAMEYYWCLEGEGYLLLAEGDECVKQKMEPGTLHCIPGHQAHRLVNTGSVPLKVACCWPSNAGHDYEAGKDAPFERVMADVQ